MSDTSSLYELTDDHLLEKLQHHTEQMNALDTFLNSQTAPGTPGADDPAVPFSSMAAAPPSNNGFASSKWGFGDPPDGGDTPQGAPSAGTAQPVQIIMGPQNTQNGLAQGGASSADAQNNGYAPSGWGLGPLQDAHSQGGVTGSDGNALQGMLDGGNSGKPIQVAMAPEDYWKLQLSGSTSVKGQNPSLESALSVPKQSTIYDQLTHKWTYPWDQGGDLGHGGVSSAVLGQNGKTTNGGTKTQIRLVPTPYGQNLPDDTDNAYDAKQRNQWAWEPQNATKEAGDLYPTTYKTLKDLGLLGRVWQAVGNDPSSAKTHKADGIYIDEHGQKHNYGGAVDINMDSQWDKPTALDQDPKAAPNGHQLVNSVRDTGIVAWYRVNTGPQKHGGNDFTVNHIHMVDPSVPNLRPEKLHQIVQFIHGQSGYRGSDGSQNWQPATVTQIQAMWNRMDPTNRARLAQRGIYPAKRH